MNQRKLNYFSKVIIISGLTLSLGAIADNNADAQFKMMDTNSDGKLSPDEHATGARKMFDTMDANHDSKVTAAEMDVAHQKIAGAKAKKTDMSSAEKIKVVDTNGDGILSADEHVAGSKNMFDKMDNDKDGFLSKAELADGHAKLMRKAGK